MADPFGGFGQPVEEKEDPFGGLGTPVAAKKEQPLAEAKPVEGDPFGGVGTKVESTPEAVGKGLVGGLKIALNPWNVTPEDMNRQKSWTEIGTEAVTQLGAGVATVAAGAALLTVAGVAAVPAGIAAAVGYGIYSGLGYESARSKATGQDYSLTRAAANVALEVNPLVKGGGKVLKALRVGAQVAGSAAVEKTYSDDNTAAAIAGVGGLLSMGGAVLSKPAGKADLIPGPSTKGLALFEEALTDDSMGIGRRTAKLVDKMDMELPEDIPKAFKRFMIKDTTGLKAKDVDEAYDKVVKQLSPEKIQEGFELFQWNNAQKKATSDAILEIEKGFHKDVKDSVLPVASMFQDPKFVAKSMDDKLGLGMEGILDSMSEAEHKYINGITGYVSRARKLADAGDKLGVSRDEIGRALAGKGKISDKAADIVGQWRTLYDDVLEDLNSRGYNVAKRVDYLNMSSLDPADTHNLMKHGLEKFRKIAARVKKDPMQLSSEDFKHFGKGLDAEVLEVDYKNLKEMASHVLGTDVDNMKQYAKAMERVLDPAAKKSTAFDVGARFQRTGEIPEMFRTFDVGQNFLNYVGGNMKAAFYNDTFAKLDRAISTMSAFNLTESAGYWSKYRRHMSGIDSGVTSWVSHKKNEFLANARWTHKFDEGSSGFTKWSARMKEDALDFMGWSTSLVYPNFLGGNVRATLRNYTQTLALTAPSLRGRLGYQIVKDGWVDLMKNPKGVSKFLNSKNIASHGDMIREGYNELGNQLKRSKFRDAHKKVSENLMYLYTQSDNVNRFITYHAGKSWAKRIIKGDKKAIAALKDLGGSAKDKLRQLDFQRIMKSGDDEALGDILGKTLISETQFHYGKSQMHQFGREGGRLFSMFTKWPMMVGSDLAYNLGKGNIRHVARKYGTPMALLHIAQVAREELETPEVAPMSAYLLGKDLTGMAPIMSLTNVDLVGGPVQRFMGTGAKAGVQAIGKATAGDPEDAIKDLSKTLYEAGKGFNPIPGAPVINEINRFRKAHGEESLEAMLTKEIGLD
ncbi:hypothetical protein OAF54_00075 [bacterium]|nr:hypothetical protein [bacterium]